jgi:hypothetical protein
VIDCAPELAGYVVVTDAAGAESELGESLAAGFESWRTEVWRRPRVRELGTLRSPEGSPVSTPFTVRGTTERYLARHK